MEITIRRRTDLASQSWEVSFVPNGIDVQKSIVLFDQWDHVVPYIIARLKEFN